MYFSKRSFSLDLSGTTSDTIFPQLPTTSLLSSYWYLSSIALVSFNYSSDALFSKSLRKPLADGSKHSLVMTDTIVAFIFHTFSILYQDCCNFTVVFVSILFLSPVQTTITNKCLSFIEIVSPLSVFCLQSPRDYLVIEFVWIFGSL